MSDKRDEFLNKLLGGGASKALEALLSSWQQKLDAAGVASKARKGMDEDKMDGEEAVEAAPAAGVSDIADMIMALVSSSESDDAKHDQLMQILSDVMAASAEATAEQDAPMEDAPVEEEEDEEKEADPSTEETEEVQAVDDEAEKARRVKAFDMLNGLVDDMGALARDFDGMESSIKAMGDSTATQFKSLQDTLAALASRLEGVEKRLMMAPRASASKQTEVKSDVADAIKSQDTVRDPFWGITRPAEKVNPRK